MTGPIEKDWRELLECMPSGFVRGPMLVLGKHLFFAGAVAVVDAIIQKGSEPGVSGEDMSALLIEMKRECERLVGIGRPFEPEKEAQP